VERFAVIGQPISHSRSPFIHEQFAAQFSQSINYQRIECAAENFALTVRDFFKHHGRGMSVTVPHKETAFALCEQTTEYAQQARAVNTLFQDEQGRLWGDNTDGRGLLNDLQRNHGLSLNDLNIRIIGAGGAARGIIGPLLEAKVRSITLANRSVDKAERLIQQFDQHGVVLCAIGLNDLGKHAPDVIIHASSAGLTGEAIIGLPAWYQPETVCVDLSYGLGVTPFLQAVQQLGVTRRIDGLGMLVEQAALAYAIWRGCRPHTHSVINSLRSQLNPTL